MTRTDREFYHQIDKWLDGLDTFAVPVEARKFMDWMRENEPDLLENWIDRHLFDLVRMAMDRRVRSERTRARTRGRARAFRAAAGQLEESGDPTPLNRFRQETYSVDRDHTRKAVGLMTSRDHAYVAESYGRQGRRLMMLEAFHRAVANRLLREGGPEATTQDVFSEEEYDRLYLSIIG